MAEVWLHRDNAVELTNTALGHYAVHRQIVLKKLKLAQKVARKQKSMAECKGVFSKLGWVIGFFLPLSREKGDDLWGEIITLFSSKAIYEDDLFQIEKLLEKMPEDMHGVFSKLLENDKDIKNLQNNLNRESYLQAKRKIAEVQKYKNPLTGLSAEDYEQDMLQYLKEILFGEGSS